MNTVSWTPSNERIALAHISHFIAAVEQRSNTNFSGYQSFHRWSVENAEIFWNEVFDKSNIRTSVRGNVVHRAFAQPTSSEPHVPRGSWFPETRLNFAENLLLRSDSTEAIIGIAEGIPRKVLTWSELKRSVAAVANFLRSIGVQKGDRVAAFLPNIPETVVAMLAATSIGAVWSSTSPDFGTQGVLDRFQQIEPKVLFIADGYFYAGKRISLQSKCAEIISKLTTVQQTVLISHLGETLAEHRHAQTSYNDILSSSNSSSIQFEQLPFDHPSFILYSSGTTGLPKCIVHGAGGTLLQHAKELRLHTDLKPGERILYTTTCGWMMWNWLVSSLSVGSTIVLYDGSLFHPRPEIIFEIVEQESVSVFGTGAKYLILAEKSGVIPKTHGSYSTLKTVLSTGSPLPPRSFDYVYENVKSDLCLSSISGGTDIISCFALGNPTLPVHRGELQCFGLGMDVGIFDDDGKELNGEAGELVCKNSFPSMPVSFWNDPNDERYWSSYFSTYPGVWRHGDWAEKTPSGGLVIYGRSDAVLNPGGVRIGTAEIARQVELVPEVLESLIVGQKWDNDERIILFVKLKSGSLNDDLRMRIAKQIRDNTTPRHVPAKIIQVPDIPRTISGKIVELAVRDIIHGKEVKNRDALANPDALEFYRNILELQTD